MFDPISLQELKNHLKESKRLGVSEVARGPKGFVSAYQKAKKLENMSEEWLKKRDNFIKRTLVQYKKKPSHRRRLALIMWAFDPEKN